MSRIASILDIFREERMALNVLSMLVVQGVKKLNARTSCELPTPERRPNQSAVPSALPPDPAGVTNTGQWGGRETILLVEDEALVRNATAEALQSVGYRVIIAGGAAQALEAYCKFSDPPELLLADIVLPGISGRDLAQSLLVLCPHLRIMLMSGYAEQLLLRELSPYPEEYLAKPFSIATLLERVRNALDRNPFDFGASA
jgi:CheY-like chemotaxis protein